jgi:hypothetical protein
MVGYPRFTEQAIAFDTLFNPAIGFGGSVQVQSLLTPACGKWTVYQMSYHLQSETPNGAWFTHVECTVFGSNSIAN